MGTDEKVRENRLRRMAERQGLELRKSARRDPRAIDYGTYMLSERGDRRWWPGRPHRAAELHADDVENT